MKEESAWYLWYSVLNATVESIGEPDRDLEFACHTSTNRLLILYVEKRENWVKFAEKNATSDVSVEIFSATMALDFAINKKIYISVTGGRNLLTSRDFPDHTRHNDHEVRDGRSPQVFCTGFSV